MMARYGHQLESQKAATLAGWENVNRLRFQAFQPTRFKHTKPMTANWLLTQFG
jgi:hypothetical protein